MTVCFVKWGLGTIDLSVSSFIESEARLFKPVSFWPFPFHQRLVSEQNFKIRKVQVMEHSFW